MEFAKNLNRSDIDAGLIYYYQCSPKNCAEMLERYGRASYIPEASILNHAWHMLVDGNGALNRLARYMCSGSVALLGTVLEEYYYRQVGIIIGA